MREQMIWIDGETKKAVLTVHDPVRSGPKFPRACPFCGAGQELEKKRSLVSYRCGAVWTEKVLCTNSRDEFDLTCGKK